MVGHAKSTAHVNREFERVAKALNRFRAECDRAQSPISSISLRVPKDMKDGCTAKIHVTYVKE